MTEHDDSADVWAVRLAAVYERMRAEDPSRPPVRFESLEAYLDRTAPTVIGRGDCQLVETDGSYSHQHGSK